MLEVNFYTGQYMSDLLVQTIQKAVLRFETNVWFPSAFPFTAVQKGVCF